MDPDRRNWWGHVIEGGFFMGGLAMVNAQTLLPSVVQGLRGPEWLVAMMPILMSVGLLGPCIFTAHLVGSLTHFRPMLLWTGFFQRVTYLAAALVLLFIPDPLWCLIAIAGAPLLSGVFGGISLTGWMQFIARTVSSGMRSSLFAWRIIVGSLLGVAGGWVVQSTLAAHPGMRGYGLLHLWAFLGLAVSYTLFATIREPDEAAHREPENGLWENLRAMPRVLTTNGRLLRLLASILVFGLSGALIPYLAIHARYSCGAPESFLGGLVGWQMAGTIAGGFAAGWVGDRHGGKLPLQIGRLFLLTISVFSPFVSSPAAWYLLFLLFGMGFHVCQVGYSTLQLDILPKHGRANLLAIMNTIQVLSGILGALIGGACWKACGEGAFVWLAALGATSLVVSIIILIPLVEPRERV